MHLAMGVKRCLHAYTGCISPLQLSAAVTVLLKQQTISFNKHKYPEGQHLPWKKPPAFGPCSARLLC